MDGEKNILCQQPRAELRRGTRPDLWIHPADGSSAEKVQSVKRVNTFFSFLLLLSVLPPKPDVPLQNECHTVVLCSLSAVSPVH